MNEFKYEELEEATHNFSTSQLIGKGSHGSIYKGTLKNGKLIAIKKQSLGPCKLGDTSKLENEARILSSIPRNQYLVNILGTSHDSARTKVLVMDHMPNGTLHEWLHCLGAASNAPSWSERVRTVIQLARAVQFLHESKPLIIHRDIKSANILFDTGWNARLADFGLAVCIQDSDPLSQRVDSVSLPAGTIGYLDPCYTTPCKLSTKNDVFSFGVVLLEIISGTKVIDVSREPASIVEWAQSLNKKNQMMDICDKRVMMPRSMEGPIMRIVALAIRCVSSNQESRPSMTEAVIEIESCLIDKIRFPKWTNMVQSLNLLKRRSLKNFTITYTATATTIVVAAATTTDTSVDANTNVEVTRRNLLISEILKSDVLLN